MDGWNGKDKKNILKRKKRNKKNDTFERIEQMRNELKNLLKEVGGVTVMVMSKGRKLVWVSVG
jgi:hypothetical protein